MRKIARLARLEVDEVDIGPLTKELESILRHAEMLEELDLAGVPPLSHAADLDSPLATDAAEGELSHQALRAVAPRMDGRFIEVPKVLGGGGGG